MRDTFGNLREGDTIVLEDKLFDVLGWKDHLNDHSRIILRLLNRQHNVLIDHTVLRNETVVRHSNYSGPNW